MKLRLRPLRLDDRCERLRAADVAARIAHQVHGAIGFTHEYVLHDFTRRLWAWRDEFGGLAFWAQRLGKAALAAGGDGLWPMVTTT